MQFDPAIYESINNASALIIPEIILLATVCLLFLGAPFLVTESGQASPGLRHRAGFLSLLALSAAAFAWMKMPILEPAGGPFRSDEFVWFIRAVSLVAGVLLTLVLWDQIDDGRSAEAHACLLAILTGVNFVAISNDLVSLFLGLELVSIPTYILLILPRSDGPAREATIKYFLLSVFSSALVLYGMSWVFGLAGTTNLTAITERASQGVLDANQGLLRIAMILVVGGLCFRLTAVPFHFYAPDVFQGVNSSTAAMLSFVPKIVGVTALLRLLPVTFGTADLNRFVPSETTGSLLSGIAILTMFVGNLMALRQSSILRLLAYSSIAHAGYMLVGLTIGGNAGGTSGITAVLFYLPMYGVMTVGVFAILTAASGGSSAGIRSLSQLSGLSKRQPTAALLMAVCVFGLSGLPPTGGFYGKLNLFLAAWSNGTTQSQTLAIVLAVNAVIAAVYYLRMISMMYFEPAPAEDAVATALPGSTNQPAAVAQPAAWVAGICCAAATLFVFVAPQWLWNAAMLTQG